MKFGVFLPSFLFPGTGPEHAGRLRAFARKAMNVVVQRVRAHAHDTSILRALETLGLSDEELSSEVLTMLLTGHHTTGSAAAWLLYRVNDLYERSRGPQNGGGRRRSAWLVASSDERSRARRDRAPRSLIDVAMTLSATTALILMAIWFFFYSQMWLVNPL